MAQKPIAMEQLKQILQLQKDGVSIREMAPRAGISRNSVRKYLSLFAASLQHDENVAYLFISHDLGVVARVAHRVAVMEAGAIAETGEARQIITAPKSPIGKALVAAMPSLARLASKETE